MIERLNLKYIMFLVDKIAHRCKFNKINLIKNVI